MMNKIENDDTSGLPESLILPVGAKSVEAIEAFVGPMIERGRDDKWLLVDYKPLAPSDSSLAWKEERSRWYHVSPQCWVEVDYTAYRQAYQRCYPDLSLRGWVIDHILNRRLARAKGFRYVRLIHVSRGVNSSSGRGSESDVISYRNPDGLKAERFQESPHQIFYAAPDDLLKMLNVKVGGFPLNNLRDNLHLFYG
ncbi:MAG: hypothetical protein SynsKO_34640 [Synoicihabitans sp.]